MTQSFEYQAIDIHGEKILSYFIGTQQEFQLFIKQQNLFLISVSIKEKQKKQGKFLSKDFIFFIEELSYLVSSGMNIDQALKLIAKNSEKQIETDFLLSTLKYLNEGNQLSSSIETSAQIHHIAIDNLTLLLIKTNESVGKVEVGLQKAKEHLEFNENIKKSIKQAMGYPIFLITMSITMVFFVFLFIVPKFATIFSPEEFQQLPFLSKTVLEIGLYVNHHIQYIATIIGGLIVLFIFFKKNIMHYLQLTILQLPFLKNLQINLQLSYFFSSLHLMLEGGVDLKSALHKSSDIVTYPILKKLIANVLEGIKRGVKMSDIFQTSQLIPNNATSLIAAGESASSLNEVFSSLSTRFIEKFQDDVKKYIAILEPAVIVFMGGIIAIIVVAIMLAVMSITDIA
jgi:general secretion pathway protein F